MKKTKLTRSLLAACSIVALSAVMYGCSSSGENAANTRAQNAEDALAALQEAFDGDGDLTPAALDALEAALTTAQGQVMTLTGERDALQAQISGDPNDPMDMGLNGQISDLTGQRDALQAQISGDPSDPSDTGLNGQIAALQAQISGDPSDPMDMGLMGQISDLEDERDDLQMQISGDPSDPMSTGLNGQISDLTDERDALQMQISGDPSDPEDGGLEGQIADLRGQITTLTGERNTAQGIVSGFETAQSAADAAASASMLATSAVETATEKSMELGTVAVNGDSAMATANAAAVLKARDDLNAAIRAAKTAQGNAETALMGVDDSTAAGMALKKALEAAIADSKTAIEAAEMAAGGDALEMAVEMVTGDDPEAEGYPTTPAQIGMRVANDIGGALAAHATETDGRRARGTHGATAPADTVEGEVSMNDHQGMTWEEIVTGGGGSVMDMRIADTGTTVAVRAMSIAGMTLTTAQTATDRTTDPTATESDGTQAGTRETTSTVNYKGIPGLVFCQGSDCVVEAVTGADGNEITTMKKLVGSWYFTPAAPMAWYLGTTTDGVTTYAAENTYATYGHWVAATDGADPATADVNTFALTAANTSGLDVTTVNTGADATTLTDTSATYSGGAAGMSVYKTFNTDGTVNTIASGAFTADVSLKATFGASPTLAGTVDNFQGGAVHGGWSVELQVTASPAGALTAGRTIASGADGVWSATSYGTSGERPMGIFGGFNAHFTDGDAAGAYAARKD